MMFITEVLILGASLVGCVGCWATVARHRLSIELQKHKITTDYEYTKPAPEPVPPRKDPTATQQALDAQKKSLDALLERRKTLENHITALRNSSADGRYVDKAYNQWRSDALKALEDARKEQQELVLEETGLLEMMQGEKDEDTSPAAQSVQSSTGRRVAQRVDDLDDVRDVELHDEEASRESTA